MRVFVLLMMLSCQVLADDPRYCGEPARNAAGKIIRNQAEVDKFKAIYPCETFAYKLGTTCSDWQVDHIVPLVCGGCDRVWNMQWLPKSIKTCAADSGRLCKDRFEQKVYCPDGGFHK